MATSWTRTRNQIAEAALRKVGNLARGQTPNPDDLRIALDALDGILKELPIFGYAWPQTVAGQTALAFNASVQASVLPADYYGNPIVSYLDTAGNEVQLRRATLDEWAGITRRLDTGSAPTHYYIDPYDVINVWPVPRVTLAGKLIYQKIIPDTVEQQVTSLDAAWMLGIPYGVALEIADDFSATDSQIARWDAIWRERRTINIMATTYPAPYGITVAD